MMVARFRSYTLLSLLRKHTLAVTTCVWQFSNLIHSNLNIYCANLYQRVSLSFYTLNTALAAVLQEVSGGFGLGFDRVVSRLVLRMGAPTSATCCK